MDVGTRGVDSTYHVQTNVSVKRGTILFEALEYKIFTKEYLRYTYNMSFSSNVYK